MKNLLVASMLLLSFAFAKAQKVKGNREVTTQIINVEPFQSINIGEELEVTLSEGVTPKIDIAADSNLHQYIDVSVIGGVLSIKTTADIRRNKEMKINIIYNPELTTITAFADAQLSTLTDFRLSNLTINVKDKARVYFTGRVDELVFNGMSDSRSECNLGGGNAQINLNGNSNTEALLKYDQIDFTMTDKAAAKIEGDAKSSTMVLEGRADLTAEKLDLKDLQLSITRNASASVNVNNDFELKASGDAEVELYNNPKINMAEFSGKAVLMKK
ncbi:Putative auto-transporter adhesin, head GIN domain [Nonlabens sp. Hel1_33_55]|uniref:GIN domain-containing protein n=1 Tax=Nonlabens sp. Hel1_33_55 TaxID=1336802 RepID=UPI000875C8CB|nr:DUF2807 domain-containing protein [Nonlabens sp. Hel1_33_55]SCY13995.1 Putative auto-transporter adhesin, head GIN domain [Nonlabens sp. Hel1_33_55]